MVVDPYTSSVTSSFASSGIEKAFSAAYKAVKSRVLKAGVKYVEGHQQHEFQQRILEEANFIVERDHLEQMRDTVREEVKKAEVFGDHNKVQELGAILEDIKEAHLNINNEIKQAKAVHRLGAKLVAEGLQGRKKEDW